MVDSFRVEIIGCHADDRIRLQPVGSLQLYALPDGQPLLPGRDAVHEHRAVVPELGDVFDACPAGEREGRDLGVDGGIYPDDLHVITVGKLRLPETHRGDLTDALRVLDSLHERLVGADMRPAEDQPARDEDEV